MPRTGTAPRYQTKKDWVLEHLRADILEGRYRPGARLITRQIAEAYGTSEIPVREALNQLERQGLVRIEPHMGAVTTPLSAQDLRELFEVRLALEGLAVRLAAPRLTDADLMELTVLQEHLEEAVETGAAPVELSAANRHFHERMYAGCHNRRLLALLSELWDLAGRYPPPLTGPDEHTRASMREHRAILAALRGRDAAEAERLTLAHKTRSTGRILELVQARERAAD